MNLSGLVDKEYVIQPNWKTRFTITPEYVKKTGFWPFTVEAGNRSYDMYVAMFRAWEEEGIPLNDKYWNEAAVAYQYGYSHWLKDKFIEYSPMTYDYTTR